MAQETTEKLLSLRIADEAHIKELQQEKVVLEQRITVLQTETAAQLEAHKEELDGLKAKVSDVLNNLVSKKVTEQEATALLQDLGCDVEFIVEDAGTCDKVLADCGQDGEWTAGEVSRSTDTKALGGLLQGHLVRPQRNLLLVTVHLLAITCHYQLHESSVCHKCRHGSS